MRIQKIPPDGFIRGNPLLVLHFDLGSVRLDNVGVFQLGYQICFVGINVDSSELIPLFQLLGGQALCLVFGSQFIDSCDYFIHIHSVTSYIAVDGHRNSIFFGFSVYGSESDFSETSDGDFAALCHGFVRLFTREAFNGGLSGGNILSSQTPADAKTGGNDTVQPERSNCVMQFPDFRFRNLNFPEGDSGQMQPGTPGRGEALENIGCNLLRYKEIAAAIADTNFTHSLPPDSRTHKSAQKIPVAQRVLLEVF